MTRRKFVRGDGLSLKPKHVKIRSGHGRGAWFYEDRNGLDVLVEAANGPSGDVVTTVQVRIPWGSIASYARRRLGRVAL